VFEDQCRLSSKTFDTVQAENSRSRVVVFFFLAFSTGWYNMNVWPAFVYKPEKKKTKN